MSGLPLIVIRPEPGATATVAAARELGLSALAFPLFEVTPVPWQAPDPADFDLILAGSANVFRHGGDGLAALAGLPVHAVGEATAAAARATGFTIAATGAGGLQPVLSALPAGARALRLAGAERIALTPPEGVIMAERTVYGAKPHPLPPELAELLAAPVVIALQSAEAARHLSAELDRLAIPRGPLALATIGPRVTAAAGDGWRAVLTADSPNEPALLAKARDLCHTPFPDRRGT
jgi:uroporphyrinogen-III synthase